MYVPMSSDCTFGALVTPSANPMMNWMGTCNTYDVEGNSLMLRYTHELPLGASSGNGAIVVVLGGTGKYKGASGNGTADSEQMPTDPNKPAERKNTTHTKIKLK